MIKLVKAVLGLIVVVMFVIALVAGGGGWSLMALTETYNGRVLLCGFMGGLGVFVTLLATGTVWIANGLTEVRRPLGRWVLVFVAVFIAPAFLALIIVTGVEVTHWFRDNVPVETLPIGGFVGGMLAVGVAALRRHLRTRATDRDPDPAPIPPAPEPVVGWDMPPMEQNWNQR